MEPDLNHVHPEVNTLWSERPIALHLLHRQ